MTTPTIPELVDAIRAELKDLIDSLGQADGNMFTRGGRDALKHMQRTQALLRAIEERSQQRSP